MQSVLLVSQNQDQENRISLLLESHFSVVNCATMRKASSYLDNNTSSRQWVFVDVASQPDWENELPMLIRNEVILIALISDPADRNTIFHAGFTDYLLYPIHQEELISRLIGPERVLDMVEKQQGLIYDQTRLVAVGRLVAHFCHDINNSLQAIGGALALVGEEPGLTDEINSYLALSRDEIQRVALLLRKMRQLYRLADILPVTLRMDELVGETVNLAREELARYNIRLVEDYENDIPSIEGSYELIQLAILNVLFILCDHLAGTVNCSLNLRLSSEKDSIRLVLAEGGNPTQMSAATASRIETAAFTKEIIAHSAAHEILMASGGILLISDGKEGISIQMCFPIKSKDSGEKSDG